MEALFESLIHTDYGAILLGIFLFVAIIITWFSQKPKI